jgi:hypothetical protein
MHAEVPRRGEQPLRQRQQQPFARRRQQVASARSLAAGALPRAEKPGVRPTTSAKSSPGRSCHGSSLLRRAASAGGRPSAFAASW